MYLLGPRPLLFCRPIWVPPEKALLLLHQPREKAHVCISCTPSSFLPASPLVSCLPWVQQICKQWDSWCSWQDTWQDAQQVGEPEAPKEGGSRWPPLSMWHPVEGWEAADRSPESIEKALQAVGSSLQTKRHGLPLVLGLDFLDFLEGEYGQCLPWCCASAWTAETGGRARTACTHAGARDAWPWGAQHLGLWGKEGRWWWTWWDRRCPLVSEAPVVQKVKRKQPITSGVGGASSWDPQCDWVHNVLTKYSGRVGWLG